MIITNLTGGLGNQLFQYATGRRLAQIHKTELFLDTTTFNTYKLHNYSLYHFNIIENLATEKELKYFIKENKIYNKIYGYINKFIPYKYKKIAIEIPHSKFLSGILKLPKNAYLQGYWQDERYFKEIRDILLREFTIKESLNYDDTNILNNINKCNSVSLHIRRGDYVTNKNTSQTYNACSLDYYYNAIKKIKKETVNPYFFIFSDDIPWAQENLKIKNCEFINHNSSKNYIDLFLMTKCKHNIIANSSFSWWGAWLNNNPQKIIIAPKKWFAIEKYNNTKIIPDNWIKI